MKRKPNKEVYQNFVGVKEKTKIQLFISEVKNAVFSVLFVLLKEEEEEGRRTKIIETTFEYFQTINFIFNPKIREVWNSSSVFSSIISFVTFFNVTSQLGSIVTLHVYLAEFYFLVILILGIVCDVVYVSISFKRKKFNAIWPLTILRNFVNIAVTVLFQPIVEVLLQMVL